MDVKERALHSVERFIEFYVMNRLAVKVYEWVLWNQIRGGKMPDHIGVILDGNRRWAQTQGLPYLKGHDAGARKVEEFLDWCREIGGIKTATIYVLSTENLNRDRAEIEEMMALLNKYLRALIEGERIHTNRIRVKVIGRTELLPPELQEHIKRLDELTKDYDGSYLNLAIAYGGRAEMLDAVKKIAANVEAGQLSSSMLDESIIERHLYTSFLPNPHPDLIIRTSGEERLSNFLLWQSAYSELCFIDVYWPSFRRIDLMRAIRVYQQRQRRFGV
jgi:tritrans,polycis-undecaprenyl-diphosphate synthase [geranylgeranyl-diphosphate specific]